MKFERFVVLVVLFVMFGSFAVAQADQGEIAGFVKDDSGKVIVGATVVVDSPALLGKREIMSNDRGLYRIINLPPGIYSLTVSKEHYQTKEISGISVRVGKTNSLNISLPVGEFAETITVEQTVPLIDTKSPSRSINIEGDFISSMPLSPQREWSQVWTLIPGVQFEGTHRPGDAGSSQSIQVHGASDSQNITLVDGHNVSRVQGNTFAVTFSTDAIEDVEVVTSGYDASIANGFGGYINIVTKSGGNDFSGSASFVFQPDNWNWSNTDDGEAAKVNLYLPEVALGGPIVKDRTWFFTSYRYNRRDTAINRPQEILELFDLVDWPRPDWTNEVRGHKFLGKVTHAINDTNKLALTFNWDRTEELGFPGTGAANYSNSALVTSFSGGPFSALSLDTIWNDNLSSSIKFSYRRGNFGNEPVDKSAINGHSRFASYSSIFGFAIPDFSTLVNVGPFSQIDREDEQGELRADFVYFLDDFKGTHELKFGFNATPIGKHTVGFVYDDWRTYWELKDLAGTWVLYSGEFSDIARDDSYEFTARNWALYLQDSWSPSERLTVSAGARMTRELDVLGSFDDPSWNANFGFNYSLDEQASSSIRASYLFRADALNGSFIANSYYDSFGGYTYFEDSDIDGEFDFAFTVPYVPPSRVEKNGMVPEGARPVFWDDDIGSARMQQFNIGYTTVLPLNLTLDVSLVYTLRDNQIVKENDAYIYDGGQVVGLKYPEYGDQVVDYYFNDKWSSEHHYAFEVAVSRSLSDGWNLVSSYTYQDQDLRGTWNPFQAEYHYYSDNLDWFETSHYRNLANHIANFASSILLPHDFILNLNVSSRSGLWLSPWQVDTAVFGQPSRIRLPDGTRIRNPFYSIDKLDRSRLSDRPRTDWVTTVNIGVGKSFDLSERYRATVQFQVFNLFNTGTETTWSSFANRVDENGDQLPTFNDSPLQISPQSPRAAQLYLKLEF